VWDTLARHVSSTATAWEWLPVIGSLVTVLLDVLAVAGALAACLVTQSQLCFNLLKGPWTPKLTYHFPKRAQFSE